MRKSFVLGAAALLALASTALTPSDAEARGSYGFRGGGFHGGGFRAAGFGRPAFGGYGWRGGFARPGFGYGWRGGYAWRDGYWGGYPRYGYYRRGWGWGAAVG